MLKRELEKESQNPSLIDSLSFKDLIREGTEKGLIAKSEPWFGYREARNITSHSYEETQAKRVYEVALLFQVEARALLSELKKRNEVPIYIQPEYLNLVKKILQA